MQDLLNHYRETMETASERLLMISEEESSLPGAAGKWSAKEIIGHLIDSAANNHQRFVRAQFSDDLVFPGYEQDDWVKVQSYSDEPWQQLVQLWKLYNLHLLHLMARTPETALKKERSAHNLHQIAWRAIAQDQPVTLEYFMRDYVNHMEHHLQQILATGAVQP